MRPAEPNRLSPVRRWFPLYKQFLALGVSAGFLLINYWCGRHTAGYFLEWLSRRNFWYGWLAAMALIYLGQWGAGVMLTVGHIVGIAVAQVLGDRLDMYDQALITPDMTAQQLHRYGPKHAFIWWGVIVGFVLLGAALQLLCRLLRRKRVARSDTTSD